MAATLSLREALNESISSGRFEDTKVILYSRRDSSGNICRPRALYASSHVLKSVPYFNDLLSGTFAEAELKDFSEAIDDNEIAKDYGYHSDSDLEDDDRVANPTEPPEIVTPLDEDPSSSSPTTNKSPRVYDELSKRPRQGKIIKIQDIAFITFQAFLLYLCTDHIEFAPYGSEENRKSRVGEIFSVSEDTIPRPSPKSIYRLADKYDAPALKKLAWDSIRDGLTRCDIVEEAFSEFASKHQEIRTAQVNHLAFSWFRGDEESANRIGERVDEKIDSYANGRLDHAEDAMALLWRLSREKGDASSDSEETGPQTAASFAPSDANTSRWRPLKIALIKSIREGAFLDTIYWTRDSERNRAVRPIYISSIVGGENLRKIYALVGMHQPEAAFPNTGDGFEDSDCEDGPEHTSESAPEEPVARKEMLGFLRILTVGSFVSWRSLFFYLYTGSIQFAPLKSQGVNARAQYLREQTTPNKPPPCSPKTIYSIATRLEIYALRYIAFNDIRSKVTSENVPIELFSGFASRENDVMKMHCETLGGEFNESTTATVTELVKGMKGGKAAYRAGPLKLALRNGRSRGVLLRCPLLHCSHNGNPISYRDVSLLCPVNHWPKTIMECADCGESLTEVRSGCRGCGEWFK